MLVVEQNHKGKSFLGEFLRIIECELPYQRLALFFDPVGYVFEIGHVARVLTVVVPVVGSGCVSTENQKVFSGWSQIYGKVPEARHVSEIQ